MDGNLISFPDDLQRSAKAKLIGYTIPLYIHTLAHVKRMKFCTQCMYVPVFSFKHWGFSLLRSWADPFCEKFNSSEIVKLIHIYIHTHIHTYVHTYI